MFVIFTSSSIAPVLVVYIKARADGNKFDAVHNIFIQTERKRSQVLSKAAVMSRSYGGKRGVWLTGRKRKFSLNRDPISKRRSFRKSMMGALGHMNVHGSLLPNRLKQKIQSGAGGSFGRTFSNGAQDIVGWDDVRCRPIYFKSNTSIDAVDDDLVKADSGNSLNETEDCHDHGDHQLETSSDTYSDENTPWNENESGGDNSHSFFKVSTTVFEKGGKKQAYGTQNRKRRGRLLSTMAASVLEQCASPVQKWDSLSYSYTNASIGIKEKRNIHRRRSDLTGKSTQPDDSSTMSFTSMRSSLSVRDHYTPPRTTASTVCLDSKTSQQECDSRVEKDVDGNAIEFNVPSPVKEALQVPQDMEGMSTRKDRGDISVAGSELRRDHKLKPRLRKIIIKEKKQVKDSVSSVTCDGNGSSSGNTRGIRQPTFSTSLSDARAFFEHLDATHVLKIE